MDTEAQKAIEQMNWELDKARGEKDYYAQLAGTYRNANHENLQRVKRLKKTITSLLFVFTVIYAATIVALLVWR